jgi:hypothetical protein
VKFVDTYIVADAARYIGCRISLWKRKGWHMGRLCLSVCLSVNKYQLLTVGQITVHLDLGDLHSKLSKLFFTYLLMELSPFEELPIVQLLKNFPEFYGTRNFITVFTRALLRSLSSAGWIKSIPSHLSL